MRISNFYDVAATYLYSAPKQQPRVEIKEKQRKVENVSSVHTGKRFNPNAGANYNHIDICI